MQRGGCSNGDIGKSWCDAETACPIRQCASKSGDRDVDWQNPVGVEVQDRFQPVGQA
jgi:hypothetical protein